MPVHALLLSINAYALLNQQLPQSLSGSGKKREKKSHVELLIEQFELHKLGMHIVPPC